MRVVVLGAGGRSGQAIAAAVAAKGCEVLGVGRGQAVDGDAADAWLLDRAFVGADAVVCALGPTARHPDGAADTTRAIIAAMRRQGVARLIVVTGAMVGASRARLSWMYRLIASMPSVAAELADRRIQEAEIRDSDLTWTILRPARLTDGPGGAPRVGDLDVGLFAHTDRADLARVVVDALQGAHVAAGVTVLS